jgi:DNA gyrase subunit A
VKQPDTYLALITKDGIIKKVDAKHFEDVRRSGIGAMKLQKHDLLRWVVAVKKGNELLLTTKKGKAIRFKESDVRTMGRQAGGVKAIRLARADELVGADVIRGRDTSTALLVLTEHGFGKKTNLKNYRFQRRGGSGIKTAKITSKTGEVVAAKVISPELKELIAVSKKGQIIRTPLAPIPEHGRATQGVRIMRLAGKDTIASMTCL